ncbi:MAG: flagellar basal body rod protein FlgB [Peptococcaceae bacterium]|nr:MAG: flagellar basal body rod protein FlgB [Peptococcaceae bacterium]
MIALKRSLDAGALRQRVTANNIANINTPGFKKSVVSFEERLKMALTEPSLGITLKTSDPRHIPAASSLAELQPQVVEINDTTMRSDGNNVDIDQEMVQVAVNTINYNVAGQALNGQYSVLDYVITGRRL